MEKSVIQQQIMELEKQILEKKASLEHESSDTVVSDKEIIHEIVGEKIKEQVPSYKHEEHKFAVGEIKPKQGEKPSYLDEELKPKVQDLINITFTKGLYSAISKARAMDNPALLKAFRDAIVDELYSKLIENKLLERVD
jgi:hypothetical protein